jgi:hypothetical protein
MRRRTHLTHPANDFQHTIMRLEHPDMRQLCIPVDTASPTDGREAVSSFKIRLAGSEERRRVAHMLVHKMYSTRGYKTDTPDPASAVEYPARLTLLLSDRHERPRGTMSLIFDVGDGLPADTAFADLLNPMRAEGRRLAEVSRLAIDDGGGGTYLVAGMAQVLLIYSTAIHHFTDWIIEVNPRHVAYYKRMLGFETMGDPRQCARVEAPAVLMRIRLADMVARAQASAGKAGRKAGDRSMYAYFIDPGEAHAIAHRLLTDYLF